MRLLAADDRSSEATCHRLGRRVTTVHLGRRRAVAVIQGRRPIRCAQLGPLISLGLMVTRMDSWLLLAVRRLARWPTLAVHSEREDNDASRCLTDGARQPSVGGRPQRLSRADTAPIVVTHPAALARLRTPGPSWQYP